MLSLVTVSPVITAFLSCYLSHHVFDQVNLWRRPEVKFGQNIVKEETTKKKKNYQGEDKKSAINKKLILWLFLFSLFFYFQFVVNSH